MKKLIAVLALLLSATTGYAAGIDLALSEETATLQVLVNPYGVAAQTAEIAVGGLINEADDLLIFASIMARGPGGDDRARYSLGAGIKVYAGNINTADEQDQTIGVLALGARIGFVVIPDQINPVDFVFEGFFAPGITSTGDTEKLWEVSGKLQLEVIPTARTYIGYRLVKADTTDYGKLKLDDNIHIGLSISF